MQFDPRLPAPCLSSALRIGCGALIVLLTACSKADDAMTTEPDGGTVQRARPPGPAADVSEEITGGNGPFLAAAAALNAPLGYGFTAPTGFVEHEYVAAGTATAYEPKGTLTNDGMWTFEPSTTAEYRTRVVVVRPEKAADSSGVVIMEWLNVSGGVDANVEWVSVQEEIVRRGHTYVGVSAQLIGVEGGPVLVAAPGGADLAGKGLKNIDPARYGSLAHPGDGYSFDIFSQVARSALSGALFEGAKPKFVIAAGESQSAIALTTYYDGVQPLTRVFDGFFVHSRGAMTLPLVAPGASADLATAIGNPLHPIFRSDLDAPVLDAQTESDVTSVLDSSAVRQPDSDRFRLWEVAGTAHADAHLIGAIADSVNCGVPINNGPMHVVAKSALRALETWVRAGTAPVIAPRIAMTSDAGTAIARDSDGIALGGIRTPPVDVPVDVLSGAPGPSADLLCILLGSTTPLPATRLAELYPNRSAYQEKYATATDQAIKAGFVLEPDRDALLAFADPSRINP
jgi:hypothetical protein